MWGKRDWVWLTLVFLMLASNQIALWRFSDLEKRVEKLERPLLHNILDKRYDANEILPDGRHIP
jgi:hypothetical protein